MMETIDLTPTWGEMVHIILTLLEYGDAEARRVAIIELHKMAAVADSKR